MKKRQINIVVAQTLEELKFILISTKKDIICLPLNLEILVYCDLNRIAYIDRSHHIYIFCLLNKIFQ